MNICCKDKKRAAGSGKDLRAKVGQKIVFVHAGEWQKPFRRVRRIHHEEVAEVFLTGSSLRLCVWVVNTSGPIQVLV